MPRRRAGMPRRRAGMQSDAILVSLSTGGDGTGVWVRIGLSIILQVTCEVTESVDLYNTGKAAGSSGG